MAAIGILGLDTSHPARFADLLDTRAETTVRAVWDGEAVRDAAYVDEFCATHDAERYDDPTAMVDDVDAALVLTVDWTAHRRLAVPFLDAGVPTFVDKPIAGSLAHLEAIEAAARAGGAPVFGGSSLPFHPTVDRLAATEPDTVFAVGYDDPFYYGPHLVDVARRLLDAPWKRVEPLDGTGTSVGVTVEDGSTATLRFDGPDRDATFGFLTVGASTHAASIESTPAELDRMYEPFIDAFVETVTGQRNETAAVLDAARLLLATHVALETGESITPESDRLAEASVESEAFLAAYEPYY